MGIDTVSNFVWFIFYERVCFDVVLGFVELPIMEFLLKNLVGGDCCIWEMWDGFFVKINTFDY